MDLHLVDARNGEASASIVVAKQGRLNWLYWLSADTLLVLDEGSSFRYSLSGRRAFDRSAAREFRSPTRVPGWTVVFRQPGAAAVPGFYIRPVQGGAERLVMPAAWIRGGQTASDFLYCWPESLGFSRLDLPSGRLSRVAHVPPEVRRDMFFYPTPDGRVIFWMQQREASKLVLVENLRR